MMYRSFSEARAFARSLKLQSNKKWRIYCKSGKRPSDIPTNPQRTYKKEWTTWGDWLGTGTIAKYYIKYRPFKETRKFVHKLGLKNLKEWRKYTKSGKKPADIPSDPNVVYKNKGWKNLGDWLGTGNVRAGSIQYRSFQEARKFVRKLEFKNRKEWMRYCKSGKKPADIPTSPRGSYKEFKDWGDWLGTGYIHKKTFSSFAEARKFVHSLKLKNLKEWGEYAKADKRPKNIPSNPQLNYKKEWKSWGDWLGTGNLSNRDLPFLPWSEAEKEYKRVGKKYNLKNRADWIRFTKTDDYKKTNLSKILPVWPERVYTKEKVARKMGLIK